jgi:hypothetical protein
MRTWSRNPRPVETSIFWTPGALSRVRVQEMLVSDVSRETVAVRAAIFEGWYLVIASLKQTGQTCSLNSSQSEAV